ncbi:MAG: M23 family metallopeptidase [Patescibacteria group bacterium]|nr:M23 family metallopeptidase [Patescibacteria group bacterium]MDD5121666.1 M23 family metallopeptidase [Patescibacteria group bacterium]MDD5222281.1 M23 family metallopeptidase [Patescibacteria group bacterium]MDD5396170.1 M23 family metallopeptidase [Patescibacteria group bacterium]
MKKILLIIILFIIAAVILFLVRYFLMPKQLQPVSNTNQSLAIINNSSNPAPLPNHILTMSNFQPPLDRAGERVTKKNFGIYITPQTSPVQPERFAGYHTGADFEIFPEEINIDVPVKAICSGDLKLKKSASGYGGVAVESCSLNGQSFTIIYGHLKLASISSKVGNSIKSGDIIGVLGAAYSPETDGERKHLHLGIHRGTAINILGYVQNKADLSAWTDPCLYVCPAVKI